MILSMDIRVAWAVANNVRWCDLVCRSLGVPTAIRRSLWVALRRSPPLYPDAVTLRPDLTSDAVGQAVVPGVGRSVKDSFATLDLGRHGFEILFEAQWIYRLPADPDAAIGSGWTVVDSGSGLEEWSRLAGEAVDVPDGALRDPEVRVLATAAQAAGGIANRTGSVVGVSNVFAHDGVTAATWVGIVNAVAAVFPGLAIVGYEHAEGLQAALQAGFEEIGPLRVWLTR